MLPCDNDRLQVLVANNSKCWLNSRSVELAVRYDHRLMEPVLIVDRQTTGEVPVQLQFSMIVAEIAHLNKIIRRTGRGTAANRETGKVVATARGRPAASSLFLASISF